MGCISPGGTELMECAVGGLNLVENSRILEIGCGEGDTLARIAEKYGHECIGIDKSRELLKRAREKHAPRGLRLKFIDALADSDALAPESAGQFDAIIMECVLSVSGDPKATLGEYAAMLKPGGYALISDLCKRGGRPDELIGNARENGLRLISLDDHTADLDSFAIQKIMEYGSLENYFKATVPKGADRCDFFPTPTQGATSEGAQERTRPPGYFLAVFQKCQLDV
jgi:ubiquinone/menaquinone biosynthesis C-methylase UbiE